MGLSLEDVEDEQAEGVQQVNSFLEVLCGVEISEWERWHGTLDEQYSGMPSHGKTRVLSVIEVYEDEGRATRSFRGCTKDLDIVIRWVPGCTE